MSSVEEARAATDKPPAKDTTKDAAIEVKADEEKPKEKSPPLSNYWRVLSYRGRQDGFALLLALACSLAAGTTLPIMNIVFGNLVGDFNDYFTPGRAGSEADFKGSVNTLALYMVYLFIAKFCLTYVAMFCFRVTGLRISAKLRLAYMTALFAQPVRKLDETSSGTVANTITSSANSIQVSISDRLHALWTSIALIIAAYAIAFRYSWALTLVTSSSLVFVVVVYSVLVPFTIKATNIMEKADAEAATIAGEIFSSIRAVFSLGAEGQLTRKYEEAVKDSLKKGLVLCKMYGAQLAPIFFSMYSSFALSFWFGIKLYREGHIGSVSTVIIVFFSVLIVTSIMGMLAGPIMAITKAVSVSDVFFDMIDSKRINYEGATDPEMSAHEDIEFKDIVFSYPTRRTVQVLKGFSATLRKGKTTALVGPSGSGKSTIVALLERWYDLADDTEPVDEQPQSSRPSKEHDKDDKETASENAAAAVPNSGVIIVGGQPISSANLKWWRGNIGLVQQEPFLFNDTILANVAFGLLGTKWERENDEQKKERVERACKEAFADEFIVKLPNGYLTKVGESGIKLSGGQRQRLAIARAIVREPAILILDEATSSIDVRAERIVQEALDRVSKDRTTVMIAHRLSTVRKADNIIVLREGRKMEEGTHEELLTIPDGLYAGLVRAQQLEDDGGELGEEESGLMKLERTNTVYSEKKEEAEAESTYKQKGFFRSLGRFLYEQSVHWKWYIIATLSAMGAGSAFALQAFIFAHVVEVFQFTGDRLTERGNFWSLMFFVLALGIAAAYFVLGYASQYLAMHVSAFYRREYFGNILANPISYYDREGNASGSLMARLSSDPKLLQELLGINGVFPLISIFNMIGCTIISFIYGWKLTVVVFFSAMPVILVASMVRMRFEVTFEEWNAKVFGESSAFATEAIGAFRTVASLTMEDEIIQRYSTLLDDQVNKATRKATYAMLVYAFSDSVELCCMALAFWYGGQLLASREYDPVAFFVIFIAVVQGSQGAGQFFSFAPNIATATSASNRILKTREETAALAVTIGHPLPLPTSDKREGAKVEFKNVAFKYPTRDSPIYRNLNLTIEPGQFVGVVGPSGCGKTTVISLLERFYDPSSGSILFDDTSVRDIELSSYRRALSLVAQEPKLFNGSIRENLVLGLDDAEVPDARLEQACRDAEIHDFVTSLPDGYGTQLGINTSTALSGGQKQRLCLARALLREPRLLLLDEATSSLDSQSEKLVQAAIERLVGARQMTVVAVAHRLATIQKADVILVFGESEVGRGSRIVEFGTHSELLRRRGMYWMMCMEQALDR